MAYEEQFHSFYQQLHLPEELFTSTLVSQMEQMTHHLVEVNQVMNLTAIDSPDDVLLKHVIDSLYPLSVLTDLCTENHPSLLDIGAGAGFPSIPLACALPTWDITALDATGKKVDYIAQTAQLCKITNLTAIHARAEEEALKLQEKYSFVTARAVARFSILVELSSRFLKIGGYLVALKGPTGEEEWTEAESAMKQMGFEKRKVITYQLPMNAGERSLLICQKTHATPKGYPRPYSKITKKPL